MTEGGGKKRATRKAIPDKTRFEVFKRDSFRCQYCGSVAPDVLLHVDHINPVSKGGTNDLLNLITACNRCNQGKGAILLDDSTIINRQRNQLEELEERRQQLTLMMEWQKGLHDINVDLVEQLSSYWRKLTPGWSVSEAGKSKLRKLLRTFSVTEITHAMNIAADQYLTYNQDGQTVTTESWKVAFGKIAGICRVTRDSRETPDLQQMLYIRGILRNRLNSIDESLTMSLIKEARLSGVTIDEIRQIAFNAHSWSHFINLIDDSIKRSPS